MALLDHLQSLSSSQSFEHFHSELHIGPYLLKYYYSHYQAYLLYYFLLNLPLPYQIHHSRH